MSKQFILQTDAYNTAIGRVLLQNHDGVERPLYYILHRLNDTMKKWPSIELEAFAIIYCLQKLDFFLSDTYQPFIIRTDCRSLTYFFSARHRNRKLILWPIALSSYNCKLVYIPGPLNQLPDYLSRHVQDENKSDTSPSPEIHNICVINTDRLHHKKTSSHTDIETTAVQFQS